MNTTLPLSKTEDVGIEPRAIDPETTILNLYTKRPISHDEAQEIAQRLINSHFGSKDRPRARTNNAARAEDDDLLITAYIMQQRAMQGELVKALEAIKVHRQGNIAILTVNGLVVADWALPGDGNKMIEWAARRDAALSRSKGQGGE